MSDDYYNLLGVERTADDQTLKAAYRKQALRYHPDRNPGDKKSEAHFKAIGEAYECLKDPQKRALYDRYGKEAFQNGGGGGGGGGGRAPDFGDLGDIFESVFSAFGGGGGGQQRGVARGNDLRYDMRITLDQAYRGVQHDIEVKRAAPCAPCNGSGAKPGTKIEQCRQCDGRGKIRAQQGFFTIERDCPICRGVGERITDPCHSCHGEGRVEHRKNLTVTIPPGVDEGNRVRLAGEGDAGPKGAQSGDLYIFIHLKPHEIFQREGTTLFTRQTISFATAALGGTLHITTLDNKHHEIAIPAGIQSGRQIGQRGAGMPALNSRGHNRGFGDMVIEIMVETPTKLTAKQRGLIEALRDSENQDSDRSDKSKHSPPPNQNGGQDSDPDHRDTHRTWPSDRAHRETIPQEDSMLGSILSGVRRTLSRIEGWLSPRLSSRRVPQQNRS